MLTEMHSGNGGKESRGPFVNRLGGAVHVSHVLGAERGDQLITFAFQRDMKKQRPSAFSMRGEQSSLKVPTPLNAVA